MASPPIPPGRCLVCSAEVEPFGPRVEDRRGFVVHLQCLFDARLLGEIWRRPILAHFSRPTPAEFLQIPSRRRDAAG